MVAESPCPWVQPLLHPATSLLLWVLALILAMNLSFPALAVAALGTSILALFIAPQQFSRLLKRSRWLLLSIVLLFSLMTPGLALFALPGLLAPTIEGLRLAFDQVSRLIVAIALLGLLLARVPQKDLIAGMRQLLMILRLPRLNADLAALRLALTLQKMEQGETAPDQQQWLTHASRNAIVDGSASSISLPVYPVGRIDKIIIGIALIGTVVAVVATAIGPG